MAEDADEVVDRDNDETSLRFPSSSSDVASELQLPLLILVTALILAGIRGDDSILEYVLFVRIP
jgi:hypothetical protein